MIPTLCILLVFQCLSSELTAQTFNDTAEISYKVFDNKYNLVDEKDVKIPRKKSLIAFAHGFRSSPRTGVVADFGKSLAQLIPDANVVMVDWSGWTQKLDYIDAVVQLPTVTQRLVDWLKGLRDRGIVNSFDDVTLMGHSLGSQLIGYAGHRLNGTVNRIIALDPAQPNFKASQKTERVDQKSAKFVMVLHTSTTYFGLREPVGHVDFYFNGGKMQPSCFTDTICGHVIVLDYLTDSLKNSSTFPAYRCHTVADCENKVVDNNEPAIYMNMELPFSTRGLYNIVPEKKTFKMYSRFFLK